MKSLILFLTLSVFIISCKKENPTPKTPTPTPVGTVDVFSFDADTIHEDISEMLTTTISNGSLSISVGNYNDNMTAYEVTFLISIDSVAETTYTLESNNIFADNYFSYYSGSGGVLSSYSPSITSSTVTITDIDYTNHRIEGTFSGWVATPSGGNITEIQNGVFDIPFVE